jgi:hypothetical protein
MRQSGQVMEEAATSYATTLDELVEMGQPGEHPRRWNAVVKRTTRRSLSCEMPPGRAAIERQLHHSNPTARGWAAAHVAEWNSAAARPVLEALSELQGAVGMTAVYTVRALDDGTLSRDSSA